MIYRCLLLFSFLFLFNIPVCFSEDFLVGTEDVPLMKGLEIKEDETFFMDDSVGSGRLFFSKALTKSESNDVEIFYDQTLPQLGWQKISSGYFEREGDVLKISTQKDKENTEVVFELIAK